MAARRAVGISPQKAGVPLPSVPEEPGGETAPRGMAPGAAGRVSDVKGTPQGGRTHFMLPGGWANDDEGYALSEFERP